MFKKKIKTVGSVSEFLNSSCKKKSVLWKTTLTATAGGLTAPVYVSAEGPMTYVKGKAKEQIIEAFMPLVDTIQALSYPIALVMLTSGSLLYMINQKDKGVGLIQNASVGYILVQLMPILMRMLVGIGETLG